MVYKFFHYLSVRVPSIESHTHDSHAVPVEESLEQHEVWILQRETSKIPMDEVD